MIKSIPKKKSIGKNGKRGADKNKTFPVLYPFKE